VAFLLPSTQGFPIEMPLWNS